MIFFKLSQDEPGGVTRRATFDNIPNWDMLAAKIGMLFSITPAQVAAAYLDADGDEVTITSDEELKDFFYHTNVGNTVKFSVKRLVAQVPQVPSTLGTEIDVGDRAGSPDTIILDGDDWTPVNAHQSGMRPIFDEGPLPTPHRRAMVSYNELHIIRSSNMYFSLRSYPGRALLT